MPNVRCRNYQDDGSGFCPRMGSCDYVHPSEPGWDTAKPNRSSGSAPSLPPPLGRGGAPSHLSRGSHRSKRCRWFEDDGTPIRRGCFKRSDCRFVHPDHPDWANAEPDRGSSNSYASSSNNVAPPTSGSDSWAEAFGNTTGTIQESSSNTADNSTGGWGQWGNSDNATENTSAGNWGSGTWGSSTNDTAQAGTADATSTTEVTSGPAWGSGATWGAATSDGGSWGGGSWGGTAAVDNDPPSYSGGGWGNSRDKPATPAPSGVNTGGGWGNGPDKHVKHASFSASTEGGWGESLSKPAISSSDANANSRRGVKSSSSNSWGNKPAVDSGWGAKASKPASSSGNWGSRSLTLTESVGGWGNPPDNAAGGYGGQPSTAVAPGGGWGAQASTPTSNSGTGWGNTNDRPKPSNSGRGTVIEGSNTTKAPPSARSSSTNLRPSTHEPSSDLSSHNFKGDQSNKTLMERIIGLMANCVYAKGQHTEVEKSLQTWKRTMNSKIYKHPSKAGKEMLEASLAEKVKAVGKSKEVYLSSIADLEQIYSSLHGEIHLAVSKEELQSLRSELGTATQIMNEAVASRLQAQSPASTNDEPPAKRRKPNVEGLKMQVIDLTMAIDEREHAHFSELEIWDDTVLPKLSQMIDNFFAERQVEDDITLLSAEDVLADVDHQSERILKLEERSEEFMATMRAQVSDLASVVEGQQQQGEVDALQTLKRKCAEVEFVQAERASQIENFKLANAQLVEQMKILTSNMPPSAHDLHSAMQARVDSGVVNIAKELEKSRATLTGRLQIDRGTLSNVFWKKCGKTVGITEELLKHIQSINRDSTET